MSFFYNIVIAPIEFIIEFVFCFYKIKIGVAGIIGAIVAVSLTVNFLALPLYNIADRLQERERELQLRLQKQIKRIKQTFKGDERFMMLQAYYRENNYHPLYALRSSLSILIEIPFFIAAYHFLSHSSSLQGASFTFLSDLGAPDELLKISMGGGQKYSINILPILMTLINFISGAIYLKKAPFKEKIQLYGLALVFLVILYDSPSGLVFYWILNNIFSLFKNLVNAKVKNPRRLVHLVISTILLLASIYILFNPNYALIKRLAFFTLSLFITLFPLAIKSAIAFQKRHADFFLTLQNNDSQFPIFILSALGLSLLTGFLLPSGIIATSPIEFSFIGNTDSPLFYIFSNLSFFTGLFLFWPFAIYKMFGPKFQRIFSPLWALLFLTALLNVYVFKNNYGNFSIFFKLDEAKRLKDYSGFFTVLPVVTVFGTIATFFAIKRFRIQKYAVSFIFTLCVAELGVGIKNTFTIKKEFTNFSEIHQKNIETTTSLDECNKIEPIYHLSQTEKNVVVLFLDRAISSFLPYIIKEFPKMDEQFSGFTYYPNTLSFSGNTAKAVDSLMGGYEYTPENENLRSNEFLRDKHNEATLLMPKLFFDAGYDVTVTDPPEPNYSWRGDLSAFHNYPEIHVKEIRGNYKSRYINANPDCFSDNPDSIIKNKIRAFNFLEIIPPILRYSFYQNGEYYNESTISSLEESDFIKDYTNLYYLPEFTEFDNNKPAYIFITNETPHRPTQLQNHTYTPVADVNPNEIECGSYNWTIGPASSKQSDAEHYHANAASLLQIAKWLDYLKINNCYDNTRIIIVSDHGFSIPLPPFNNMNFGNEYAAYNPLLLVKDFYAKGSLKTDFSFMTNADTILFATKDLCISEINPFTGKLYKDFIKKDKVNIYAAVELLDFNEWNPEYIKNEKLWILQDEKYHTPSYIVHDNIFDESNWERIVK